MKKLQIALITLLFFTFSAFAFDKNDINPKGSLTSYTKTDYNIVSQFGNTYRYPSVKYEHIFDENNREVESACYNAKNVLVDRITYQYNSKGRVQESRFYNSSNVLVWKNTFEYDESGRVLAESEFNANNELIGKTIYEYTAKDKTSRTTESYYNGQGALLYRNISLTNENNQGITVNRYFGDGSLDQTEQRVYSENGYLQQSQIQKNDGKPSTKTVYLYDAHNFLIEIQTYNQQGILYKRELYKNDSNGNPTTISTYTVAAKFGSITAELQSQSTFVYEYRK